MNNVNKGLVRTSPENGYQATFQYVREAEARMSEKASQRAVELIESAYRALDQALHEGSRSRKSTLYLAARMAAGLALRELTRPDAANAA